jgi:hypothetical protein
MPEMQEQFPARAHLPGIPKNGAARTFAFVPSRRYVDRSL